MSARWTEERVAELRRLAAQGISWTELGRALGVTDNGAMHICRRLGIVKVQSVRSGRPKGIPWKPRDTGKAARRSFDDNRSYDGPPIGADGERERREREREADELFRQCLGRRRFANCRPDPEGRISARIDPADGMCASSLA